MDSFRFWFLVSIVSGISIFPIFYHFVYTADTTASISGYFFSVIIVPILIVFSLAFIARVIWPYKFNQKQKWLLFICPSIFIVVFLGLIYSIVQYGSH